MRKIPTLFVRDPDDRAHVLPTLTPGLEWVLAGEGAPSRKWDGTCMMLDTRGRWWARREVKLGRETPYDFQAVERDEVTGSTVGWIPVERSPFAAFHAEAVRALSGIARPGTYELIGPRINGNPEGALAHVLVRHGGSTLRDLDGVILPDADAAWVHLRAYFDAATLATRAYSSSVFEGVVWAHPDGRAAKLKVRDFPPTVEVDEADPATSDVVVP